jgi:energy-coupling factor transport system permease protein
MKNVDPRTKILLVMMISTLAVVINDLIILSCLLIIGALVSKMFGGSFFSVLRKVRKMLFLLIGIIVLQSIFNQEGIVLIGYKHFNIITDVGLIKGLSYLFRILIILVSATILSTSSDIELVGALIKCKIPYDFAFMVSLGIRFMPIFMDEFKNTIVAIELRGVHIKALRIRDKLELYGYILSPIVIGALDKAKKLSLSIEMRGFRAFPKRTSHFELRFALLDYFIIVVSSIGTVFILM